MKRIFLISLVFILIMACDLPINMEAPPATDATLSPNSSNPGIVNIANARMVYYEIRGSNESDLRQQLNELGPVDDSGRRNDASTKWYISWNWPGYGNTNCSPKDATTKLDVQVIFPKWNPPSNAAPEVVAKWTKYTQVLSLHEKGHVDNVMTNYQSVLSAIKAATCSTAEAAAQAALGPIRQNDISYDAATQHGATQGATFP